MTTVFDHINAINTKNEYSYDEENEKDYVPLVVNKAFSHFPDTIFIANEANKLGLSGQMHYDFMYYMISPRKRYSGKWAKKEEKTKELHAVSDFYNVSFDKARELLKSLTDEEVNTILMKMNQGGYK